MAAEANTLLNEARCLGCASNASTAEMLKLGLWQRLAGLTDVDEIVDSFVERSGISDPAQIAAVTQLVVSARVHGWWNKCDLIYPFVGGAAAAHAENLKSADFPITWNGTVTHDANGITGNAATGYGATGYIPANSGQISLNSAHISAYRKTTGGGSFRSFSGSNSGSDSAFFISRSGPISTSCAINSLAGNPTNTGGVGFLVASRVQSSQFSLFLLGVETVISEVSVAISTQPIHVLALNNNGVASQFSSANLAFLTAGSGLTFAEYQVMNADIQVFETALGRAV